MLDALIGEIEVPEPSGDWRADLRTRARNERAALLRHLWVMDFLGGRPPLGPSTLLHLDRALGLLDGLGLDLATAVNMLGTVQTYVLGSVLREMREARAGQEQSEIDPAEWEPTRTAWRNGCAWWDERDKTANWPDRGAAASRMVLDGPDYVQPGDLRRGSRRSLVGEGTCLRAP
jgi:Tetracyclin repressor-like, C-terminal domain